ncbi:MAG: hypothetical protein M3R51_05500 [Candidatus Eremiobacteraeota bacterium]|nr:hypothetical protein [Candidatus Eremiobacteraeota bacterium]
MIRACFSFLAAVLIAGFFPVTARASLVADPQTLYNQMKAAYDRAAAQNWNFRGQEVYLSTIFNAGRAYALQSPNDPAYGEIATLAVRIGAALHYNPLTNHDATTWYIREAALWVEKNSSDPALGLDAKALLSTVDTEDDPQALVRLADAGAAANAQSYPHDTDASLEPVEADWRGWLLTHDASWRSLAFERAAQSDFPLAHIPTTYGPEFIAAVQSASSGGDGYTDGDRKNASTITARLKNLEMPLVIASVKSMPHDAYLTTLAPADEYFGRMGYSVLGIQNELKHINFMLDYNYGNREAAQTGLVAESIDDMHKVYPRDRDMPRLLLACISTLDRMTSDEAKTASAHLRSILVVEYQDSPEARKALAASGAS